MSPLVPLVPLLATVRLALGLAVGQAAEPQADPVPVVSIEQRGPACGGPSLRQRVDALLEGSQVGGTSTAVEAMLDERDGVWSVTLRWGGQSAPRRFEGATCQTVLDAAAFVIAVAVDPTVVDRVPVPPEDGEPASDSGEASASSTTPEPSGVAAESTPEPPPDPSVKSPASSEPSLGGPLPPPEPSTTPPSSSTADATARPRLQAAVGVSAGVDGSALPVGVPIGGHVGLLGSAWRVDLRGHYRSAARVEAMIDSTVGGRIGGWALGLRGCWRPAPWSVPLELPVCGSAEAGQVLGEGFGFAGAVSARLPWTALLAELGARWVFGSRVAVGLDVQLGASVLGGRLIIDQLEPILEVGPFVARGLLSVEVRVPARSTSRGGRR